jgi:chromosome segregation ATPase
VYTLVSGAQDAFRSQQEQIAGQRGEIERQRGEIAGQRGEIAGQRGEIDGQRRRLATLNRILGEVQGRYEYIIQEIQREQDRIRARQEIEQQIRQNETQRDDILGRLNGLNQTQRAQRRQHERSLRGIERNLERLNRAQQAQRQEDENVRSDMNGNIRRLEHIIEGYREQSERERDQRLEAGISANVDGIDLQREVRDEQAADPFPIASSSSRIIPNRVEHAINAFEDRDRARMDRSRNMTRDSAIEGAIESNIIRAEGDRYYEHIDPFPIAPSSISGTATDDVSDPYRANRPVRVPTYSQPSRRRRQV